MHNIMLLKPYLLVCITKLIIPVHGHLCIRVIEMGFIHGMTDTIIGTCSLKKKGTPQKKTL